MRLGCARYNCIKVRNAPAQWALDGGIGPDSQGQDKLESICQHGGEGLGEGTLGLERTRRLVRCPEPT
jgi:hypothetical protein